MAVSSMNVSAVAPEGYDVNNDGRVNIAYVLIKIWR